MAAAILLVMTAKPRVEIKKVTRLNISQYLSLVNFLVQATSAAAGCAAGTVQQVALVGLNVSGFVSDSAWPLFNTVMSLHSNMRACAVCHSAGTVAC